MHISTSSMHISTPTEQGAKFGVCDTPVMASVESSLMMADTTPCDSANENSAIDWGECMICQKVTREELKCPSNGSRFDAGAVYEAFAGRFQELRQILSEPNKHHFMILAGVAGRRLLLCVSATSVTLSTIPDCRSSPCSRLRNRASPHTVSCKFSVAASWLCSLISFWPL